MKEQPTLVEKEPIDQNLKEGEGSLGGLAYTATKEVTLRNDKSRDLAETIRRSQESSNRQSGD
jgi:hypothetical protein